MKKFTALLLLVGAFASNAFAHHMAQSDTAGVNIVECSPHLLMVF
jgi:hypothetical protein